MKIRTRDKELYNKLRLLNFTDEVLIKGKKKSISKLKKTSFKDVLGFEEIGNNTIIKRLKPCNINIQKIRR